MGKFLFKAGLLLLGLAWIVHLATSAGHPVTVPSSVTAAVAAPHAAPASAPAPQISGTPGTHELWARAFLKMAGFRRTPCNKGAIEAWENEENTPQDWKNPLADTLPLPGSVPENSAPVMKYRKWIDGLDAAVHTLRFHPAIEKALRQGNDAQAVADAVQVPSTSGHMWGTAAFQATCTTG